jgi:hypothetical protein
MASRLLQRDSSVAFWRAGLRGRCLQLRARLALARNAPAEARSLAEQILGLAKGEAARSRNADTLLALVRAEMLRGDIAWRMGDRPGAESAWRAALAAWPQGVEIQQDEQGLQAVLLQRVGRSADANAIAARLAAMGYRHPEYLNERTRIGRG